MNARRAMGAVWCIGAVAACWAAAPPATSTGAGAAAPVDAGVVARAREAVGLDALRARGSAIRLSGEGYAFGADGRFSLLYTPDGRFVSSFEGPLGEAVWFDGQTMTTRDFNDSVYTLELGEREAAMAELLIRTGLWLAEGSPMELGRGAGAPIGGTAVGVRLGSVEGTVVLDGETWLPVEFRREDSGVALATAYAEHRPVGGVVVAGRVESRRGDEVVRREAASVVSAVPVPGAGEFVPQRPFPDDTAFDAAAPAALEVRRAPTNHLLVPVRVNGSEPTWFIFDSGAGAMTIDSALADKLGLPTLGHIAAGGAGGEERAEFRRAERFEMGPMAIEGLNFIALDLSGLSPYFGVELGGIVGFCALQRCVAETDLAGAAVSIHDPRTYELARGVWEPLVLESRHPCARGEFEGRSALFKLDTGAANLSVTFHAPAVREMGLLEGRETAPSMAAGVGGAVPTRAGELADFTLGGHRFERPRASFATEQKGAFANASVAGTIGGELLRPFVLVTDYHNGRIALVAREGGR